MANQFDLRKFLNENKLTKASKALNENELPANEVADSLSFDMEFKQAFTKYLQEGPEPETADVVDFEDTNRGIEKNLSFPKTSEVVNLAIDALRAAGVDSIEKLYAANNMTYSGQSMQEFFDNIEEVQTYSGIFINLTPEISFGFQEQV